MKSLLMGALLVAFAATSVFAAECMVFPAKMGNVQFDHDMHKKAVKNCKACHEGKVGKIEGFNKDSAHKLCIDCHKSKKMGPTGCKDCHKK